jgi:hypothetical protein
MPPNCGTVLRIGCVLERTRKRLVLRALGLAILVIPHAHALTYGF